jgi:hypothetical protein
VVQGGGGVSEEPNIKQHVVTVAISDYYAIMLDPSDELRGICESVNIRAYYDDTKDLPTEAGVYRLTLESEFVQGYFEGYPAAGESEIYLTVVAVEPLMVIEQPTPKT